VTGYRPKEWSSIHKKSRGWFPLSPCWNWLRDTLWLSNCLDLLA